MGGHANGVAPFSWVGAAAHGGGGGKQLWWRRCDHAGVATRCDGASHMKYFRNIAMPAGLLLGAACVHNTPAPALIAQGVLADGAGAAHGMASIREQAGTLSLLLTVSRLPPGSYGAHIHAVGRCDGPGFTSAGPHWNPGARQHGRLNPAGTHAGDLPNLVIAADGTGSVSAPLDMAAIGPGGPFDADGAAVIIHAMADDERSDPTGNSGARMLCTVLERVEPLTP